MVITAKNQPKFGHKFFRPTFFFCGPFWAFWPEFLPPGNTAEDLFTAGRASIARKAGRATATHHTQTHQLMGGGGAGVGGGGGTGQVFSDLTLSRSYSWDSGYAGVIEWKWRSSVLSFAADCIPIVGAAKSLVLNDKRFNHTKVCCIFIFIDLQAS